MTHAQAIEKHAAERYLLDEMPEIERHAFEAHFFSCPTCAEDVRAGGLMREGVAAGLLPPAAASTPAVSSPAWSWRDGLPWAVAATLALAVGYQSLWVVPGLRNEALSPQAVTPIALRAATRGAEPVLTRPSTGVLPLALDLTAVPAGTRLAYDLRAADGTLVASGTAVAPPPGTPLLVLVPGTAFPGAGSYVLSLDIVESPEPASVDYRFAIADQDQ